MCVVCENIRVTFDFVDCVLSDSDYWRPLSNEEKVDNFADALDFTCFEDGSVFDIERIWAHYLRNSDRGRALVDKIDNEVYGDSAHTIKGLAHTAGVQCSDVASYLGMSHFDYDAYVPRAFSSYYLLDFDI